MPLPAPQSDTEHGTSVDLQIFLGTTMLLVTADPETAHSTHNKLQDRWTRPGIHRGRPGHVLGTSLPLVG
jgi:hypothetical protein